MATEFHCEYCGKDVTHSDYGDVDGAIVCLHCMENEPEAVQRIKNMEEMLRGFDKARQEEFGNG